MIRTPTSDGLIETAKLNGVDPQAQLTNIPGWIADQKFNRINELIPFGHNGEG